MLNGASVVKSRSKTVVVCDAGPLIHLQEVGHLHLLADFQKIIVPHGVEHEVVRYRRFDFAENDIAWLLVPARLPLERSINAICKLFALDAGEVEAISILTHEPGALFLTDDAAARIVAGKLGYRVHGTIGILVRAIRRDLLEPEEVIEILHRIRYESTLHIKESLLQEVISIIKINCR